MSAQVLRLRSLNIVGGMSPLAVKNMREEVNNGRLAMVAVVAYVVQEAMTGEPVTSVSVPPHAQRLLPGGSAPSRRARHRAVPLSRVPLSRALRRPLSLLYERTRRARRPSH